MADFKAYKEICGSKRVLRKIFGNIMDEHSIQDMIQALRQAVHEAFTMEVHPDITKREERTALLNALQGILEKSEPNAQGIMQIDFEDLFLLHRHRGALEEAAHIHEAFMGNYEVGAALRQITGNIESAQKRFWIPEPDGLDTPNDEFYQKLERA